MYDGTGDGQMSGICGVFSLAGAPVEEQLLRRMAAASAYRGPDGVTCWTQGPAGLAHLAFHTTPEAVRERQPLLDDAGRYCLVADARIDNRDEIIPSLMASGSLRSESPTDAEVILAAYACWGEDCGQHLIGDYAFAIWDALEQRLFAARDAMGVRQLYYTVVDGVLTFATTLASLIAALPERPALNGPLIYEFLGRSFEWARDETVYAGVCRLPPAHCLTAAGGGVRLRQYYIWGSQPPPAYRSDEEWILGFRELFDKVLRAQLRSVSPVGILLSGGLDSSAIACAVHHIGQQHDIPEVKLVSGVFDHTPSADERQFIHLVQEACPGFEPHPFVGDEFWGFRDLGVESGYPLDEPDIHPVRAHTVALFRTAADAGCRVVLSGDMANYTLGDAVYATPHAIRAVARRDRLSEMRHFQRTGEETWITFLLRAYTPAALLPLYRRATRMSQHLSGRSNMPWIRRPDGQLEPRSRREARWQDSPRGWPASQWRDHPALVAAGF